MKTADACGSIMGNFSCEALGQGIDCVRVGFSWQ